MPIVTPFSWLHLASRALLLTLSTVSLSTVSLSTVSLSTVSLSTVSCVPPSDRVAEVPAHSSEKGLAPEASRSSSEPLPTSQPLPAPPSPPSSPAVANHECVAEPYAARKDEDSHGDGCFFNLGVHADCVQNFWTHVREVFMKRDLPALSKVLRAELRVNMGSGKHRMVQASSLATEFDTVFTPEMVDKLSQADPNDGFCNYQGATFAQGLLWANPEIEGGPLRISVINSLVNR